MKRSGNVGLVLMGSVAFAATFAAGMTYFAWQKPSHAATAAQAAQSCTPEPGTENCEPARRGFAYYFYPRWTWSPGRGWGSSSEPRRQRVALSNNPRSSMAPSSTVVRGGIERSGFGSSARGSFRVSAGG